MSFADWFSRRPKLKSWEKRGSDYIFTLEDGRVIRATAGENYFDAEGYEMGEYCTPMRKHLHAMWCRVHFEEWDAEAAEKAKAVKQ